MARLRSNNVFGTTTNNPLLIGGTTLNSNGLANLIAVAGVDRAAITLDPNRVNGAPEIVWVSAHTGAATSATILRAQEGTVARQHPSGTFWVHGASALDLDSVWDPPACRVHHNAAQSIADNTETTVAFNSERYDTDVMHDTVTNNSRITIKTAGIYVVTFGGRVAAAADYNRLYVALRLNGVTYLAHDERPGITAGPNMSLAVATQYKFAVNDYVEARVYHDNTANAARNLLTETNFSPEFSAIWVGSGD